MNSKLKEARLKRNWSQEKVAEQLKIDRKTYNRWETGKTEPQLVLRQKICDLFEMTAEELGFTYLPEETAIIPNKKPMLTHSGTALTPGLEEVAAVLATIGEMSMAQFDPTRRKTLEALVATIGAAALSTFQTTARLSPFQATTMHPVAIGIPLRYGTTDRERLLIAAEDAKTGERLDCLLRSLAFSTTRFQIEPTAVNPPSGDAIVVCGPKSAPVAEHLLDRDPVLRFIEDGGRWWIENRHNGTRHGSPTDANPPQTKDIAYVACHRDKDRVLVHIAGIHSIGSLGAAHYLAGNLTSLFTELGDVSCSFLVEADYDDLDITSARLLDGPHWW